MNYPHSAIDKLSASFSYFTYMKSLKSIGLVVSFLTICIVALVAIYFSTTTRSQSARAGIDCSSFKSEADCTTGTGDACRWLHTIASDRCVNRSSVTPNPTDYAREHGNENEADTCPNTRWFASSRNALEGAVGCTRNGQRLYCCPVGKTAALNAVGKPTCK